MRVAVKRIYVGNLPYSITEVEVRKLFEAHGTVHDVYLINDRDTGKPRGFGFVKMEDKDADRAIHALDHSTLDGRDLRVNEARRRPNVLWSQGLREEPV